MCVFGYHVIAPWNVVLERRYKEDVHILGRMACCDVVASFLRVLASWLRSVCHRVRTVAYRLRYTRGFSRCVLAALCHVFR